LNGQTLSPQQFWENVSAYHPVARQALLLEEEGRQSLLEARAAFDPKISAFQEQKYFGGKDYFTYGSSQLKVPTPWGPSLKAGYDWTNADGLYLNPERTIPEAGQAILGLEVPLLRGLLFDEARSDWRQAQLGIDRSAALARQLRNYLFLEAHKLYWDWAWAYYAKELAEGAQRNSLERLAVIRESFLVGDYAAIDTLEAFLQVQSWQLETQDAAIALAHAENKMQSMYWQESGQPVSWNSNWQPLPPRETPTETPGLAALQQLMQNHPSLTELQLKLSQLDLERRWKTEQFKPELSLNFNLLANEFDFNPGDASGARDLLMNNYKWGFRFSYPLFLRKARAGLAKTDIKIAQTEWKLSYKQQQLTTQLQAYWQEWQTRQQQVVLAAELVANYQTLLEAEQEKFSLGESSVFLLNSRQQKLLSAQLKELKAQAEWQKVAIALWYTVGEE
jgi:outer membrane protein TolC